MAAVPLDHLAPMGLPIEEETTAGNRPTTTGEIASATGIVVSVRRALGVTTEVVGAKVLGATVDRQPGRRFESPDEVLGAVEARRVAPLRRDHDPLADPNHPSFPKR